jgi:hypothetical protein
MEIKEDGGIMKPLIDHHHYKKGIIPTSDRVAVYERYVIDLLTTNSLPDEKRDSSIAFELKHHHSTAQFARIFARKRNLPEDVCVVGALLHDISVTVCGTYKNHAHESAEVAQGILDKLGLFSQDEKDKIIRIIYNHSDKEVFSNNKFEEFGKDVDILDSFLYPNAFGYYLKHKKLAVFMYYIQRAVAIWSEMGLDIPRDFSVLDNYDEQWLNKTIVCEPDIADKQIAFLLQLIDEYDVRHLSIPSFAVYSSNGLFAFYFNSKSFDAFVSNVKETISPAFDFQSAFSNSDLIQTQGWVDTAKELLSKSYVSLAIIWSAIDSYELLDTQAGSGRISELGIKL